MSTDSSAPAAGLGWPFTFSWPMPGSANAPQFTFAPERLWQPVNPGWSFGNLIVNQQNSSAPEVEQALVSQVSYGKQIGRIMEAVEALMKVTPLKAEDQKAATDFAELAAQVKNIKEAARHQRLARLREEINALRKQDEAAWQALADSLR